MTECLPVTKSIAQLKTWTQKYAPEVTFRPAVSPAAIANFIAKSSLVLPEYLRQFLFAADGETRNSAGMIGNWRMMPICEIQADWGLLTKFTEKGAFADQEPKPSPYIVHAWWHKAWIPIVTSDTGDYICIDTNPPEPQRYGQVLLFLQDRPERYLVAGSLRAWLDQIAKDLEAGLYKYDIENGFNSEAFMWSALEGKHLFDEFKGKLIV